MKNISTLCLIAVVAVAGSVFYFTKSQASASSPACSFTRTLELGSVGDDVRCLQVFLNESGFKISEFGVGSPGQETVSFGALTKDAVMRWQAANNFSLASGAFGPISKAKYLEKVASFGGVTPLPTPTPVPPVVVQPSVTPEEIRAKEAIKLAFETLEDAENAVDDIDDDNDEQDALEDIVDAKEDLLESFLSFINKDFEKAKVKAEDVTDSLGDIIDDVFGDKDDAEEAINDAEEAINDAEDEINSADDDGDDVHDANDKLDDARDKLDDAQDAFDDKEYDNAESLAKQAENMADDAIDLIGN